MVAIAPFRAVRYDPERVDLDRVTSPPHDVITPAEQAARLAADPHSILNVILPPTADGDAEYPASPNKYERSRDVLATWQQEGIFVRDAAPALYLYEVKHAGGTMRGLLCRIGVDPTYTHIQRHEKTLKKKKRDRLNLRETTRCDTESIWLLYRDERGWVDEILTSNAFDQVAACRDEDGVEHILWRIDRPEAVGEVVAQFEDRDVVIADGHHRYQTSLDHLAATGRAEDGSLLVCLVRDNDPGLSIEPTHRIVLGVPFEDVDEAAAAASDYWNAEPLEIPVGSDDERGAWLRSLVNEDDRRCILLHGDQARLLRLQEGADVDEGRGRLDTLVVTRVHERLLGAWGITAETAEDRLRYTRSAAEAVAAARDGHPDDGAGPSFVVMLRGEDVDSVLDVAQEGHVMPQKATYFVPKLRSGLVLGPLDEPLPVPWQEIGGDGGPKEFRMPALD